MAKRKIKNLICGNSVAALVCAERLLARGEEALVLSSNGFWGGHFGGLDINGTHYDLGMNLFEFTSYRDEPNARIETYDPKTKNDSGRFVNHIRNYIEDELGVKTVQTETPQMYFQGEWYDDFIISDRFESLSKLPPSFQKELAEDLGGLKTPNELHASKKNRSKDFAEADLEKVSRANHGNLFHREFIEPLCGKITNMGSNRLLAYYHRLAWLPLFYPETLKSYLSDNHQAIKGVVFNYPVSGDAAEPIKVLTDRLKQNGVLEINPLAEGELTLSDPVVAVLETGEEIYAENLVWAGDRAKLAHATGWNMQPLDAANITCAFFEIKSEGIKKHFSSAFIVDGDIPCYRITQFDRCAGAKTDTSRICMEFNTDKAKDINSPDFCMDILQTLKVADTKTVVLKEDIKNFKQALMLPTPENLKAYSEMDKVVEGAISPALAIGGTGGFSSTSFNDQVVQGMKAAQFIAEGV